jgi:hypothetical protein
MSIAWYIQTIISAFTSAVSKQAAATWTHLAEKERRRGFAAAAAAGGDHCVSFCSRRPST